MPTTYRRKKPTTKKRVRVAPKKAMTKTVVRTIPRNLQLFPKVKNVKLVYKNPSVTISSNGIQSFNRWNFALNNMFDFDWSNIVGNKQPLYYDTLLSGVGPYRSYKVNAWKTYIKIQSLETSRSIQMFYQTGIYNTTTDTDNLQEVENMPGTINALLCPIGSGKGSKVIKSYQTLKKYLGAAANDLSHVTSYASSPATQILSTLALNAIDGSATAYSFQLQLTHVFYATLYDRDAQLS